MFVRRQPEHLLLLSWQSLPHVHSLRVLFFTRVTGRRLLLGFSLLYVMFFLLFFIYLLCFFFYILSLFYLFIFFIIFFFCNCCKKSLIITVKKPGNRLKTKKQQINVQKSVLHVQSCFFANWTCCFVVVVVVVVLPFSLPPPFSITRFYILFVVNWELTRASTLGLAKSIYYNIIYYGTTVKIVFLYLCSRPLSLVLT